MIYILSGEDGYLKDIELSKIKKGINGDYEYKRVFIKNNKELSKIEIELSSFLTNLSFFSEIKILFLDIEDSLSKNILKMSEKYNFSNNVIIISTEKPLKIKNSSDICSIECNKLIDKKDARRFIEEQISLLNITFITTEDKERSIEFMIESIPLTRGYISTELSKLSLVFDKNTNVSFNEVESSITTINVLNNFKIIDAIFFNKNKVDMIKEIERITENISKKDALNLANFLVMAFREYFYYLNNQPFKNMFTYKFKKKLISNENTLSIIRSLEDTVIMLKINNYVDMKDITNILTTYL